MSDATMSPTATRVDPVTASVIRGALANIAIEMGYKLICMSYSSIIRECEDFGAALIDDQGNQLCETTQSTPLQSGPIPGHIRGMLRQIKASADTIEPGDVIMHNDPYGGASHGPDVAFVVPVFFRDELIGFEVTTAHHLGIGALSPGSCGIVDAMDAYAEGLQFKAAMEIFEGAYGGRCGLDGMDSIDTLYANTRNNPIEDLESHLPLRIERYELRDDVCPAGQWCGGLGPIREFTFLEDGGASIEGEGHVFAPWGFTGGHDGATARVTPRKADGTEQGIPSKMPFCAASQGDTFIVVGPAGGDYGDPRKRVPERVLCDVLDGFLTREQAHRDHGVVIRDDLTVDHEATAMLRIGVLHAGGPQAMGDPETNRMLVMPLPG